MYSQLEPYFLRYAALVAALLWSVAATAAVQSEPFTMQRFSELQTQGANILVHVHASWCPNCRKQREILSEYRQRYPDSRLHILNVDFDEQKEWVTYFKAPQQSTLILYSGTERVWFSVAETREERIFAALNAVDEQ